MDLKFWKKDDDFSADSFPDLPSNEESAFSQSPAPDLSSDFSAPTPEPSFSTPASQLQPAQQAPAASDDVHTQLILARLDAITNKLDVLSSRIQTIENQLAQQSEQQQAQKPRGPWYGSK